MRLLVFLLAAFMLMVSSCKFIGCYSREDACYECCKEKLNQMRRLIGGQKAHAAREPCVEECVNYAEYMDKDAYWIEDKQMCLLGQDMDRLK
jgi:hypothetical protein